jgi:hypothetical protein
MPQGLKPLWGKQPHVVLPKIANPSDPRLNLATPRGVGWFAW